MSAKIRHGRRPRVPALLRDRVFRRFWIGQTTSMFGDQISLLAIPLVGVLVLDAGPRQMGYLTAAGVLPSLLFSLHAGAWVDRTGRRRRTMIATDVLRAALLLTVPIAYAFDALHLPQLYVVTFLIGTLDVFFFVAYTTLFVALVPPTAYVEASALLNGSRAVSFVGGQGIAGGLVALLSAPVTVAADAVTFVVSALFLRSIDPAEPPVAEPEEGQITAGARFIRDSPVVRAALGATATVNFFNYVFFSMFILYVTEELGVSPSLLGLVLGTASVGAVIGAAATSALSRRIGVGPAFLVGCVVFPTPLLLVPLAGGSRPVVLALLFAAEFGSGLGVVILDITGAAIFAAVVPDAVRARVTGAYRMVNYGMRPLGAVTGGLLGSTLGLRPTLWIAALGGACCALWLLPSPVPRLRELPVASGDVTPGS